MLLVNRETNRAQNTRPPASSFMLGLFFFTNNCPRRLISLYLSRHSMQLRAQLLPMQPTVLGVQVPVVVHARVPTDSKM